MTKGQDIRQSFEDQRRKINESFAGVEFHSDTKERIITIAVLAVVLAMIWFMLDLVIVTFILTFVFYQLQKYTMIGLSKTPLKILPAALVQILVYIGVITALILLIMSNIQAITSQVTGLRDMFTQLDIQDFIDGLDPTLIQIVSHINISQGIAQIGQAAISGLGTLGSAVLNLLIAFFLSFMFILEKDKIVKIAGTLKESRVAFLYRYFLLFFKSFCYAFAQVMKVQVMIAAVNCAILAVYLIVAGFPYVIVLSIMIFLFSLIPVAGVPLSAIPLVIIGFSIAGPMKVLEIIIVFVIVNIVEMYVLDPKLMSNRTALPISFVILILIMSSRYLGIWGMLVGIPLFIFMMIVLNIDYTRAMEREKKPRKTKGDKTKGSKGIFL